MTQDQAIEVILDILKKTPDLKCKIPFPNLNMNTQFRKEMGFDSISMVAFFYELQDRYPDLEEEMAANWTTLGDCARSLIEL